MPSISIFHRIRQVGLFLPAIILILFMQGCGREELVSAPPGSHVLKVAVTIVPQATFIKAVGGDLVDVVTVVPPGGNPENYSPTPQQMLQITDARLFFAIGVPSERTTILPKIKDLNPDIKILDLPQLVDQVYPPCLFPSGERDPHMWLSPRRVKEIIRITSDELSNLDPAHRDIYARNAAAYSAQLDQLDQEIRNSLANMDKRTFIVYHPAFGYFAADYGLEMIALESEGKEATAVDLQKIIDLARQKQIKVVFYQAEIDSKQSRTLAEEIGGQAEMIAPLDPDYIDNLRKTAQTFARVLNTP